jgi:hypothetical protein
MRATSVKGLRGVVEVSADRLLTAHSGVSPSELKHAHLRGVYPIAVLSASATGNGSGAKICPRCQVNQALEDFPVDRSKASGRKSLCRACDNAKSRRFYAANQRRVIARVQAYQRRAKESR